MWSYTEDEQDWLSAPQPLRARHFAELTPAALDHYLDRARQARAGALADFAARALHAVHVGFAGPFRRVGAPAHRPRRAGHAHSASV